MSTKGLMSFVGSLFRIAFALIWCSSLYYDVTYQPRLGHNWYIYKLIMLTNLNFVILTIFSVFSLLDALPFTSRRIKDGLDFTFHCTIFPVATVTCLLFWGLYAINPELVMPEWVAKLIPGWLNHVTHTLPIFYIMLELLLFARESPTHKSSASMALLHIVIYFVIIFTVRIVDGYWLYPLLELFTMQHYAATFIGSVLGYYLLIRLSVALSKYFTGAKSKTHSTKPKKYA
ncbi:FAR-17a/AIG1-like protein [Ostertagia ostertagi]